MSSYPNIAALLSMEYEGKGMPNYITRMKADRALLNVAEAASRLSGSQWVTFPQLDKALASLSELEAALGGEDPTSAEGMVTCDSE